MPTMILRVLVVDDNRDGADALGLLAEELGHQVHVTYGGVSALEVAQAFQPDLMLIDLAMPDMDGCSLCQRIRHLPIFAQTPLVAITGHADQGHKTMALKAGFDRVLFKPVSLTDFKAALASDVPVRDRTEPSHKLPKRPAKPAAVRLLPIDEARRIRNDRRSKSLTESESQAAICDGFIRFQADYLGWRPERIQAHFIKDLLVIRIQGSLTRAECQLAKAAAPEQGRILIKQVRKQLLEVARPMLESMIHEVAGVKAQSMHHDISTVTGEEVVLFGLAAAPRFEFEPNS
ncbi:MAG: Na-translocating system protein MpsC family protein [Planctomycetales bacterium]